MGCCESSDIKKLDSESFSEKIKAAIDSGSINRLSIIISLFRKKNSKTNPKFLDDEIISVNNIGLNPLSYALFLGKANIFRFLHEKGASFDAMDEILENSKIRAINIICYKGYKDLLEFYLPFYLKKYGALSGPFKSFTIDLKDAQEHNEYDLPIHSACRTGMIHIVLYLFKYFKDQPTCPREFDIFSTDDYYGEDAAMIACRIGNFGLVKMLYETCGADFKKLNNNNENSLMVCMSGYRNSFNYTYIECVNYLIEIIGVDVTYNHEELLFLAEGPEMTSYIESKLEEKGITTKKSDIDKLGHKISIHLDPPSAVDKEFFSNEVREYLDVERSFLSSIPGDNDDRKCSSLLNEFIKSA